MLLLLNLRQQRTSNEANAARCPATLTAVLASQITAAVRQRVLKLLTRVATRKGVSGKQA